MPVTSVTKTSTFAPGVQAVTVEVNDTWTWPPAVGPAVSSGLTTTFPPANPISAAVFRLLQ